MERYFFDIWDGNEIIEDEEGHEERDMAAVKSYAIEAAREMMAVNILRGIGPSKYCFYVRTNAGLRVLTLPFVDAITGGSFSG